MNFKCWLRESNVVKKEGGGEENRFSVEGMACSMQEC